MISDDDLLLYYYRDGLDAADRARVGAALAESPELSQRYHRLVSRLDAAAAATPEVPVPPEFQRRWQLAIDEAASSQGGRAAKTGRALFNYAPWYALAAGVFLAVCTLLMFSGQPPKQVAGVTPPASTTPAAPSAYERGLKSHLASTEQQLASLESASPEERKRLVDSIIEQNRIYALAADKAGEPQLARVLRAFTPVLESLQQGGGDTAASLDQLEFELRVMQGRLAAGNASRHQST